MYFEPASFTLTYRAGAGGSLSGATVQTVHPGGHGSEVIAHPEAGAVFHRWCDGVTTAARTDTDVQGALDVTATFRSTGGADLDWYAARGILPVGAETWAEVDARPVPDKGTTLWHENMADTEPDNPDDTFRILAIDPGPPVSVLFTPASTAREYRLRYTDDLASGTWHNLPGQEPRFGGGGDDAL